MRTPSAPNPLAGLTYEQVLAEIEDVIRAMPDPRKLHYDDASTLAWLGRASAVMENWSMPHMVWWNAAVSGLRSPGTASQQNESRLVTLLHQAQHDLLLKTAGPGSLAIGHGGVYDYFDEIRKIIELAVTDLLFIDPYLDASFVSRYLPHVKSSASVRLLGRNQITALKSAAQMFAQQHNLSIEVRSSSNLHDRHVIIDSQRCFTSGASFKDGAKRTGTTITETVDAATRIRSQPAWHFLKSATGQRSKCGSRFGVTTVFFGPIWKGGDGRVFTIRGSHQKLWKPARRASNQSRSSTS